MLHQAQADGDGRPSRAATQSGTPAGVERGSGLAGPDKPPPHSPPRPAQIGPTRGGRKERDQVGPNCPVTQDTLDACPACAWIRPNAAPQSFWADSGGGFFNNTAIFKNLKCSSTDKSRKQLYTPPVTAHVHPVVAHLVASLHWFLRVFRRRLSGSGGASCCLCRHLRGQGGVESLLWTRA